MHFSVNTSTQAFLPHCFAWVKPDVAHCDPGVHVRWRTRCGPGVRARELFGAAPQSRTFWFSMRSLILRDYTRTFYTEHFLRPNIPENDCVCVHFNNSEPAFRVQLTNDCRINGHCKRETRHVREDRVLTLLYKNGACTVNDFTETLVVTRLLWRFDVLTLPQHEVVTHQMQP